MKFRSYDDTEMLMIYSDGSGQTGEDRHHHFGINFNGHLTCHWVSSYDDSCGYPQEENGELDNIMYCTELQDNQGQNIYTGDVVAVRFDERGPLLNGVVVFNKGVFRIKRVLATKVYYHDLHVVDRNLVTVINNVYESESYLFEAFKEELYEV